MTSNNTPLTGKRSDYHPNMLLYSPEAVESLICECMFQSKSGSKNYLDIPAAFDTETSSFIDEDDYKESALVYIWMFGIGDTVIYSRNLDDFPRLCYQLNEFLEHDDSRLIVYVHFLKFDFSFIKKCLHWDNIFITGSREPLYAVYKHIEFRDSLVLAGNKGLDYVGKHLRRKVKKATGDLDYEKVRTPITPLTDKEMHYCEMDIRVLNEYIREKIEDEGNINNVPYTNTGYVRRYVREQCFKDRERYMSFMDGLTMTPDCYLQCDYAFQGGAVGPNIARLVNPNRIDSAWENVNSYDIKSSYPYVMVASYYPISMFVPVKGQLPLTGKRLQELLDKYCCLFTLELWDIEPTTDFCFPISYHKLIESAGIRKASGRVMGGMYAKLNCTELDFDTIRHFYKLTDENCRITRMRIATRGFLPYPIVSSVYNFFNKKTTLDGVKGSEVEYMVSKNMLNSIYGMMVERPVRPVYGYTETSDFMKAPADFFEQVEAYNNKWNRFLYYPWGVWVTAHARHRLYDAIYNIGNDFLYCDTDSVKFTGNHNDYFKRANEQAKQAIIESANRNRLALDYCVPRNPKGSQKWLGVWEHEWTAKRFKTLGAKRYLVEKEDGKLELTVAGTNKSGTLSYMVKLANETGRDVFEIFDENLVIPAEYAKRTVSKFIDDNRNGVVRDYMGNEFYYNVPSGINVTPASYSFSVTDEMKSAVIWLSHDGHYQATEID